jgi:hypothetical protein
MTRGERQLSYTEFGIIWIVILSITLFISGCATYRSPTIYHTSFGDIYLAEEQDIATIAAGFGLSDKAPCRGFYWEVADMIFCPYQSYNKLPDFYVLGHEVWHNKQLGGKFHE